MTTDPDQSSPDPAARVDLDALFRDVPVLSSPHGLAAPEIFPDDGEFEEFLAWLRAERRAGTA